MEKIEDPVIRKIAPSSEREELAVDKMFEDSPYGGANAIAHEEFLQKWDIYHIPLHSRSDIVKETYDELEKAEESVYIKAGDADFITEVPNPNKPITGKEWQELYKRKGKQLGKENVNIIMHIEGWGATRENAKTFLDCGVTLWHLVNDFRGGVYDGKTMFEFYRAASDEEYRKVLGHPQQQDERVDTKGLKTPYRPYVKRANSFFKEMLKTAQDGKAYLEKSDPNQKS